MSAPVTPANAAPVFTNGNRHEIGSDIPTDLAFVNPAETVTTWRVVLWAEPGQGKSVAGCTAPDPILVVSADRPTAYMYVRRHHARHWLNPETGDRLTGTADGAVEVPAKHILETRFIDWSTMVNVYKFVRDRIGTPEAIRTLVVDPISNIYDFLVGCAPIVDMKGRKSPDYQWVNKKLYDFVTALRPLDVNLILIGHVKEPKEGTTMVGPNLGGPALTEKLMREMDIVAHVELQQLPPTDPDDESEKPRFRSIGQVQTLDTNLICKDGTNALGGRRVLNLARWFDLASLELGPDPAETADLPWGPEQAAEEVDATVVDTVPER